MIIVNLKGGLGNQMFQYATGLFFAQKNNDLLLIDNSGYFDKRVVNSDTSRAYRLDCFNISAEIATQDQIKAIKYPLGIVSKMTRGINKKILKKYYLDFHPEVFEKRGDIYLDGFFQSEKNFLTIRSEILKEFTLKNEINKANLLSEIQNTNSVSVHIRRGDYVKDKNTNQYHGTCSKEYYLSAIEKIKAKVSDPVFYFFSDDLDWVKNNFNIDNIKMKIGTDKSLSDCEELILMSKCKHNIIANSSFSWWGAWLNINDMKMVYAPSNWVNKKPNPHPNIIPESWIKI